MSVRYFSAASHLQFWNCRIDLHSTPLWPMRKIDRRLANFCVQTERPTNGPFCRRFRCRRRCCRCCCCLFFWLSKIETWPAMCSQRLNSLHCFFFMFFNQIIFHTLCIMWYIIEGFGMLQTDWTHSLTHTHIQAGQKKIKISLDRKHILTFKIFRLSLVGQLVFMSVLCSAVWMNFKKITQKFETNRH